MQEAAIWGALFAHILVCFLYFVMIKLRIAHVTGAVMPIMLLIPVFGPLSVLLVEWIILRKRDGIIKTDIHKQTLGESIYNKILVDEKDNAGNIVPLEEAILINDVATRRALMLDILHRDPAQYLDLLMLARFNSDIEITHYATTTIMEIQREYELAIQQLSVALKENPNDEHALNRYIEMLGNYTNSGLLHGHLLYQKRVHYSVALQRGIELNPDKKSLYFRIIDNDIALKDYYHAEQTARLMRQKWPWDENVWLAAVRVCVESGDREGKEHLIYEMKKAPVEWTQKGREQVSFWYGPKVFKSAHTNRAFNAEAVP